MKSFALLVAAVAVCAAQVPAQNPLSIFYDDFSANLGWTLNSADWQIGPATPSSGHTVVGFVSDPANDADGTPGGMLAGVVIGGNAPTIINGRQYFTSPVIPSAGFPGLKMAFQRQLGSDYPNFMTNGIDVWNEATMTWDSLWLQPSNNTVIADQNWTSHEFNLSQWVSNSLQVRFWYEVGSTGVYTCPSWSIDNVDFFLVIPGGGQPSQPGIASLDVNGSALSQLGLPVSSGDNGIYAVDVASGGFMSIVVEGTPLSPWVLLGGNPAENATSIAPFGQIDLGTPGFGGLEVLGSGLDAGFLNAFFNTNAQGTCTVGVNVPAGFVGLTFGLQGVMTDPIAIVIPTNAVAVSFI